MMLIFAVDDERINLEETAHIIRQAAPDAEIAAFLSAADALDAIQAGRLPDIVFTDIEMPGISGLEFAVTLKRVSPNTRVVFVTGYPQYALDAFRTRAQGYLLKPITPPQVQEELEQMPSPPAVRPDKLRIQCFGHFEVFWQDRPVIFARRQSKELLAFLVDREGRACTAEEIAAALWENEGNMGAVKARIRRILSDLKSTLHEIGMDDVLIRERRQIALRRDLVDCDYYRMLAGDVSAINSFRGEYMPEYSWAELTAGRLYFRDWNA